MDCRQVTGWASRIVDAGGCAVNLLAAAILVPVMRLARGARPWTRYLLWLLFTANVFTGGGYLMVLSFAHFGDWNAFVQGLPHQGLWRLGLTALGVVVYLSGYRHARRWLEPFLGRAPGDHDALPLGRSPALVAAGALALVALVAVLGPGLPRGAAF